MSRLSTTALNRVIIPKHDFDFLTFSNPDHRSRSLKIWLVHGLHPRPTIPQNITEIWSVVFLVILLTDRQTDRCRWKHRLLSEGNKLFIFRDVTKVTVMILTLAVWSRRSAAVLMWSWSACLAAEPCSVALNSTLFSLFSFSLCFNGHFPGGPGLAGTRMYPFWFWS